MSLYFLYFLMPHLLFSCYLTASSVEIGSFYSFYKEKTAHVKKNGVAFFYEMGEENGIQLRMRHFTPPNSYFPLEQAYTEFIWNFPIPPFTIYPVIGSSFIKRSEDKERSESVYLKSNHIGMGIKYHPDTLFVETTVSYLFPWRKIVLFYHEKNRFLGSLEHLNESIVIEGAIGYKYRSYLFPKIKFNWIANPIKQNHLFNISFSMKICF